MVTTDYPLRTMPNVVCDRSKKSIRFREILSENNGVEQLAPAMRAEQNVCTVLNGFLTATSFQSALDTLLETNVSEPSDAYEGEPHQTRL